jgi:threonine aldolase
VHAGSHVYNDECNAPEFFSGARLVPIAGSDGKLRVSDLASFAALKGERHAPQPAAISLAQATETGGVYDCDELAAIGDLARSHGLRVHQDGARFANAVAAIDRPPSELTWKAGSDILSFGATKNGCFMAEAVLLFDPGLAEEARYRAKRAGQLPSKMRFISAQLLAYVADDLWLHNARHANAMARLLAETLAAHRAIEIPELPPANMVFAKMPPDLIARLEEAGLAGYHADGTMRLCTSWITQSADLDRIAQALLI